MSNSDAFILYEYPFTERIRTLLRLEDLFEKLMFWCDQTHHHAHHAALMTLFEILEITSRSDLRGELLQEMERHKQSLLQLRNNPQVSEQALAEVLAEIDGAQVSLNSNAGRAGQYLRDNEWLMSIRSRAIIPGGTCEFDLPSYHAWLMRDLESRRKDLETWVRPLMPFRHALSIVLRLLRETAHRSSQIAGSGSFQQMLQGRTWSLLQVRVDAASGAVPEISANKYMLWIRFTSQDRDLRPRALDRDVSFELSLCAF